MRVTDTDIVSGNREVILCVPHMTPDYRSDLLPLAENLSWLTASECPIKFLNPVQWACNLIEW